MDRDEISKTDASDFKIGDWWVRPQRNELERAGDTVHIEARSMDVLVCLGRHAPAVVSKERLVEEVWTDSPYIGDDAISHAIWELRKALGDSARDPVYIQTVPRKGYRLVAEILRPQGSALPMEGVRIDHYDLGEELGRGSMGVVYRAEDRRLGRTVAIKFLAPELTRDLKACERFQREARLAASLDHPNLATVHEVGETSQGHRYLVNAYYRCGSLKDRLAEGPIRVDEALRLVRQLVAGLGAAHQRDIVHRDIKPANLLLDEHGTLKICDFGIAKLLGATDLTRTGAALGTPAYKSPEQADGRSVDHRTDLWAVGVVLFELLTSRRPFEGEYEHAVVHSILSREPRAMEDAHGEPVPEPLRRFVGRALAKDPADRFQSAEEMLVALDGLEKLEAQTVTAQQRRGTWRWLALVSGILVVALALWVLRSGKNDSRKAGVGVAASEPRSEDPISPETEDGSLRLAKGRELWLRGNHPENLKEVRKRFEEAVDLMPKSAEAKGQLAAFLAERYTLFRDDKDHDAARELIGQALALDPETSLALAAESWLLIFDKKPKEAEEMAREAIRLEPKCGPSESCDLAYVWLAEALWVQGQNEEALNILAKGLKEGGGSIRCRLKRAQFYRSLGQLKAAEDEYEEVLDLDKQQTTALNEVSNVLLAARRFDDAIKPLEKLHAQTQDPKTLNSLGSAYYMKKWWPEAIKIYQQAFIDFEAVGGGVPTPLVNLGDVYLEQGKTEEAQVEYQRALEVFDSIKKPGIRRLAERAVCLAKLERFDEAKGAIQDLLDNEEDVKSLVAYAARIYALEGDRDMLLVLARRWQESGGNHYDLLDDAAFIPYRENREYQRTLQPELALSD